MGRIVTPASAVSISWPLTPGPNFGYTANSAGRSAESASFLGSGLSTIVYYTYEDKERENHCDATGTVGGRPPTTAPRQNRNRSRRAAGAGMECELWDFRPGSARRR